MPGPVQHLPLNTKSRVMGKAEKRHLLHGWGHVMERGRVSTQLILSNLWGTDMSYRFKQMKELGTGIKYA
jgi:hypothetical protein